eukprot:TRINITY_DN458_c3_g1_i1.p1 TRINITY_DN458_c3_g1~~TRINITY_DN458_c3_g1_i1.p1  ORF type:complete len:595 (+),score=159.31 TRINITY_DN458_c3_g1_i1:90-1874(+)
MATPYQTLLGLVLVSMSNVHLAAATDLSQQHFLGLREGHDGSLQRRGPSDLLAELERLERNTDFDHDLVTHARVDRVEAALLPMFRIAPKNEIGEVDAKAARYLLHRLFVQRHAWHVNGVELHGKLGNDTRVGEALFGGGNYSLRRLAHFAATLETLVHVENVERLQQAFDVLGFSRAMLKDKNNAVKVLEAYMAYFVSLLMGEQSFENVLDHIQNAYPAWPDTLHFVEGIREQMFAKTSANYTLWDVCLMVVEEVGEQYGRWQNRDCVDLKHALMKIETPGTGRVSLTSFWAPLLEDQRRWLFDESLPYLEQLGALEGDVAPYHNVVIPNYLYSPANCLAGSKYYDVCCINECETLLGEIEAKVAKPAASPEVLAEIMMGLGSSTKEAPWSLSETLRGRLEAIGDRHGGMVPLHGRLFAQFLHHAYPLECPYPHLSFSQGTEHSTSWIHAQHEESTVDRDTLTDYMEVAKAARAERNGSEFAPVVVSEELPWNDEEDLFLHGVYKAGALAEMPASTDGARGSEDSGAEKKAGEGGMERDADEEEDDQEGNRVVIYLLLAALVALIVHTASSQSDAKKAPYAPGKDKTPTGYTV